MRKLDLLIIIGLAATGAAFYHERPSRTPEMPRPSANAPGRFTPESCHFAGLALGATPSEALARLGVADEKRPNENPRAENWIYRSQGGSLDLYWYEGRLTGIHSSVVMDKSHAPPENWLLAPGLGFGASPEAISSYFGPPSQVQPGKVENWSYATSPGRQPPAELALGFENKKLLHVRMSLR